MSVYYLLLPNCLTYSFLLELEEAEVGNNKFWRCFSIETAGFFKVEREFERMSKAKNKRKRNLCLLLSFYLAQVKCKVK